MTTPTPRTGKTTIITLGVSGDKHRQLERELAEARASVENYASAAEELRLEVNELTADLTRRDHLLGMIRAYPYIPQGLAAMIDKEVAGWGGKG